VISVRRIVVAAVFLASAWPFPESLGQEALALANAQFRDTYRPWLEKYCGECHFGATVKAGVILEADATVEAILLHSETWNAVRRALSEHEMPPDESPQPDAASREAMVGWLNHVLETLYCSARPNAGAVTIRRLNRNEYRNTVRDFVGVDYEPAREFPGDDTGYGFDNIGDVLSLPPILLEKYLAAAEQIAQRAIIDPAALRTDRTYLGSDFDTCRGSYIGATAMVVAENGAIGTKTELAAPGRYSIEVTATGHQAGDEPVRFGVLVDGRTVETFEIASASPKTETKSLEVDLPAGEVTLGIQFLNDFLDRDDPRPVGNDRNLVVESARIRGPAAIPPEALPQSHRKLVTVNPDEQTSQLGAARIMIPQWLAQGFRRPPTEDETNRLVEFFRMAQADGHSFEQSLRLVLQAILVSPHFLFRVEEPIPEDGTARSLTDYELATALSYFLWGTMPDAALFAAAAEGRLANESEYRRQIERMLADPKATNLVENFAVQWLQLRQLDQATPSAGAFPEFSEELRESMRRETLLFVGRVIRGNESILRLLNSRESFLDERLAAHYGVEGVAGTEFRSVDMSPVRRGGLLTQASILTLSSYPARTSPVKRGKWIMENLLGEMPPPPDPMAMPLDEQRELTGTLRQRMEQHRKNPACASCHERMDALGFALENYDAIGRWRELDAREPIDATAAFPDGTTFRGADELQQLLSGPESKAFLHCFAEKLLIFALGRGLEYEDQCAVDEILRQAGEQEFRANAIITGIALSQPFRQRQRRGGN
jgi:hypothetical protein